MAPDLSEHGAGTLARASRPLARRYRAVLRVIAVVALTQMAAFAAQPVAAQSSVQSTTEQPVVLPPDMTAVPFGVGEKMEYDVKFSSIKVGSSTMEVRDIVTVRGQPSWHTVFTIKGKAMFLSVNILLESWFDVVSLVSRRFHQDTRYTGTRKVQTIEIFPERGMFKEDAKEERVTVSEPLDDGSFLFFVRSIPLEVGETYSFQRYYNPEKNPVTIKVVRRETVTTPAGTFKTIVLQPKIKAGGLFGEGGKAEVWLTDDSARMMVQLKSDLSVGSINLYLSKFKMGTPAKP